MDGLSEERRSWNMSRIRGTDTQPEMRVRKVLHRMGYRFRLHRKDLPGKPDIVLPKYRAVIFVHGCYWHRHPGCKLCYIPRTRRDFWLSKFEATVRRDAQVLNTLATQGWNVVVVWECELQDQQALKIKLREALKVRC